MNCEVSELAFPETWMNELMSRNDIVSVVSEYTRLKPKGGRMWGLCPFHPERDPSFSVSPDKQLFHCFSCKAGGSVIQFVMQAENLPYIDAVKYLAQRAGMDLPDEVNDAGLREQKAKRDRIYAANKDAARFFRSMLMSEAGATARQYLLNRGIGGKIATKFGLGYSPKEWDSLFRHMTSLGYKRDELIEAGLCVKGRKDPDATFDFFRNRLMFPVIAANGAVIAFGGRILSGEDGAKYMNTGDTLVYNKRHNVYGINLMKGRKLSDLIIVEGYMDVISLHQAGIDNAVASLGTALTGQQARLMSRFAPKVMYAYDGDSAGQKAMLRGIDVLSENHVEARVIVIPGGMDPDEFVRSCGSEAFLKLKDSSLSAAQFKLEFIRSQYNFSSPEERGRYAAEACKFLASLEPVEREMHFKVVSECSGIDIATIRKQCGNEIAPSNETHTVKAGFRRMKRFDEIKKSEQMLLACLMVSRSDALQIIRLDGFSFDLFSSACDAEFAKQIVDKYEHCQTIDYKLMIAELNSERSELPGAAISLSEELLQPIETAKDCIGFIIKNRTEERIRCLSESIANEKDPQNRAALLREQMELLKKRQKNF